MTPQLTMLASTLPIALMGIAFLPQQVGPDNTGSPDLPFDDRSTVEVYADYFPSPAVDATGDNAPRLQRDLSAQPVFSTAIDPDSPLQRKLAQARATNQTQQTRRAVTSNTRSAKSSNASSPSGTTQRRGGTQTIVELARTRLASFNRLRFKSIIRHNREELRRQQLRRVQSRRQPRVVRQSNVRERLRNNASRGSGGSQSSSNNY